MYQSLDNSTQPIALDEPAADPYDEPEQLHINDSSQQQSDAPRLPMTAKRPHPTSTIVQPSREDNILCCSKVLHRHILHNDHTLATASASTAATATACSPCASAATDPFHIAHFIPAAYLPSHPPPLSLSSILFPFTLHTQQPAPLHIPTPTPQTLAALITHLFRHTHLQPECVIIALIYIERLAALPPHTLLTSANHIPLLLTALLTASKVWDDQASYVVDFTSVLPLLTVRQMGRLERVFVQQLQYTLYISSSEYAKYFYALRSLRKTERVPRYYLSVGVGAGGKERRVELATGQAEAEEREMPQSL